MNKVKQGKIKKKVNKRKTSKKKKKTSQLPEEKWYRIKEKVAKYNN